MTSTLDFTPSAATATPARATVAQARHELVVNLRNAEQLLLTIIIPAVLLLLFSSAHLVNLPKPRVDFLLPGVLALAVMSTAFTGQAIAVGFERRYGVLRRLGTTPLTRGQLLVAKTISVALTEVLQIAVLCAVAAALGWSPRGGVIGIVAIIGLLALGTATFSSLGLLMAGTLRAEATLAAANLVYLLLLVLGGVAFPLSDFGSGWRDVLQWLPITALSDGLRAVLLHSTNPAPRDWLVLAIWLVVGAMAAVRWFRWE